MNENLKYKGRAAQLFIYFKKLLRMFVYQNDWKVLPMSAVIAALVVFVIGSGLFVTQEGTITGCFALACVSIWNGFFNSIQAVCRERAVIKREHRAGLYISSYIGAHMLYQFIICLLQVLILLAICRVAKVAIPAEGPVTGSGVLDLGISLFLITFASDMMSLFVSSLVRDTTTAMTVMPFLLIFQLVFSGAYFQISGPAANLTKLTVSNWGLNTLCAVGRYNELPMVTLWNTLFKFKDITVAGATPVLEGIRWLERKDLVKDFIQVSGEYNRDPHFVSTAANVGNGWMVLLLTAVVCAAAAVIALKMIDRDRR